MGRRFHCVPDTSKYSPLEPGDSVLTSVFAVRILPRSLQPSAGGVVVQPATVRDPRGRLPAAPIDGETLLKLGRASSQDALEQLRRHSPEALAGALLELAPSQRVEFLETAERLDEIVPLLPEAEFARTLRGAGIEESGWLVEFASPEQRVAAVDLDCWKDFRFSPSRLLEWIDAMIEAGPETLAVSFYELDPEVWVLAMRALGDFSVLGLGDVYASHGTTGDGLVFYDAHSAESEDRIREILSTALHYAPSHYSRLVYGAITESGAECEAYASRWQRNRLADLGFPDREQAMRAYEPLKVAETPVLDLGREAEPGAVVVAAQVPSQLSGRALGRTLAELPPHRTDEVMNGIFALANALAVADRALLMEPETVEQSLEKAVRGIDRGLEALARARNQTLGAVLDATPPLDLFRIGATLDPDLRPRITLADLVKEEELADWNVELEMISEEDSTLGGDGRLKQS